MSQAGGPAAGSVADDKSSASPFALEDDKSAGVSVGLGDSASSGVSIPDSVVAPLIGAGANVYILTNELTQSMREKLGTSWPVVQDTLNSRSAKLLAGGFLASVATILLWKIIRRLASKPKPPAETEEEACQWTTTKTYEVTPMADMKQPLMRSDAETAGLPLHMLPHKIQLRIAESPLPVAVTKGLEQDIICKARDPATRHRHTRRQEQHQGEQLTIDPHSPWHSEQQHHDLQCACPSNLCTPLPLPRLLYSVRESRMVQRAMNLPDPRVVNYLTHNSCPSTLYPTALDPWAKPCYDPAQGIYTVAGCSSLVSPNTTGLVEGMYPIHPALPAHGPVSPSCLPLNQGAAHCLPGFLQSGVNCVSVSPHEAMRTSLAWPGGVSLCSVQNSRPLSSLSGITQAMPCQLLSQDRHRPGQCRDTESQVRSVCQQTDGHPVEEDLDMPAHTHQRTAYHVAQAQHIPTRTAQSPVTPSKCTNTPLRPDNTQMHFHPAASCPTRLSNLTQSHHRAVYQAPQDTVFQGSQGSVLSSPCQGSHQHASQCQQPEALSSIGKRGMTGPGHHAGGEQVSLSSGQQAHQQPVIQHPSDSSMSQNSSEACTSQDRQCESVNSSKHGAAATSQDMTAHEGVVCQQQHYATRGPANPPRAITNFAQNDYPWRGAHGLHSYQPTPIYVFGYQPPTSKAYSPHPHNPWSSQAAMFFSPFISAPPGLFANAPSTFQPSSQGCVFPTPPGHMMAGHLHNPYGYHGAAMSDAAPLVFNPNFNLNHSNTHPFVQDMGRTAAPAAPYLPDSSSVRLVELDHGALPDNADASAVTSEVATASTSMTSTQDRSIDPIGGLPREANISASVPDHMHKQAQPCGAWPAELAATEQVDAIQPDVVQRQKMNMAQDVGAAAAPEETAPCPAGPPVEECSEEFILSQACNEGSTSTNGMETQL